MRNTNRKRQTTNSGFFIRRVSGTWAILDIHGQVFDSGFASEAAGAGFIVRFLVLQADLWCKIGGQGRSDRENGRTSPGSPEK